MMQKFRIRAGSENVSKCERGAAFPAGVAVTAISLLPVVRGGETAIVHAENSSVASIVPR